MKNHTRRGFTLIEVIVALAILAVTLAAVARAGIGATNSAQAVRERALADWVARNRLATYATERAWLAPGSYGGTEAQAGQQFAWEVTVSGTPHRNFRRVEVKIKSTAPTNAANETLVTRSGFLVLNRD